MVEHRADFLSSSSEGPARLRRLVADAMEHRSPLVLPGCYDALGARLVEQAGFDAAYMTGFGTTASLLGRPDVGLLGMAEMVDNARRIVGATGLPVVADADTGYGNHVNVVRAVHEYERAGVAGIHIEDQVNPKRCGHMDDKEVVDVDTMTAKVSAAVAARSNDDFMVIARTDARAPLGLDEALRRGHAFLTAGADALFIEAPTTEAEVARVAAEFAGVPLVFNWVEGGKTPALDHQSIAELGFALILVPIGALLAATTAIRDYYARLQGSGTPADSEGSMMGFGEFTDMIGLPDVTAVDRQFGS